MTIDKAKEFLVELADNDEAAAGVDAAYLDALKSAAAELGYTLSDDDLTMALVEMTGRGDDESRRGQAAGSVGPVDAGPDLFGNPLNLQPRTPGV